MSWFNRKKKVETPTTVQAAPPPIEVVAHKNASAKQVKMVEEANKKLNEVFERNHFTVKLYVATGGTPPKAKT